MMRSIVAVRDMPRHHEIVTTVPAKYRGRELSPAKAVMSPLLGERNVLTNSPWMYVRMWLTRRGEKDALFYWDQANEFRKAASGLPVESAPLVLYYSFLNATKALLSAKGIVFNPYHGVGSANLRGSNSKILLSNEGVKIKDAGVLPSLSAYYGETEPVKTHNVRDMLFNLAFVHRTYSLSYTAQTEMFIPLVEPMYVHDKTSQEIYFSARVSKNLTPTKLRNHLPTTFIPNPAAGRMAVRSAAAAPWPNKGVPTKGHVDGLVQLHRQLRVDLQYINGPLTLWYIKGDVSGAGRLERQPTTLSLAVMHRLSELSRYKPLELRSLLGGRTNWLISEFIDMAPPQFIDEIACELTGNQFLIPNVRSPT
jgi:hypothetical protein